MEFLKEGVSYGLQEQGNDDVEAVHVKLTDTASKVIEDYMRMPFKDSENGPTIQINGSSGLLNFPNADGVRSFSFGLTQSLDSVSALQCVKQKLHARSISSLGSVRTKLSIHATNDSFAQTREKMTIAEEDHKKACVKEIKATGPGIGKRIKKRIAVRPDLLPVTKSSALTGGPNRPSPVSAFSSGLQRERTVSPIPEKMSPVNTSNNNSPVNLRKVAADRLKSMKNNRTAAAKASLNAQNAEADKNKPKFSVNPRTLPLKDRVIHLLAIRPYTKPELLLRLQRDGLDERSEALDRVVSAVCTSTPTGRGLTLQPEVQLTARSDWPLYTAPDRQLLARNRQRVQSGLNKTSRSESQHSSASSNSVSSPAKSNRSDSSPAEEVDISSEKKVKRAQPESVDSEPEVKRSRVSSPQIADSAKKSDPPSDKSDETISEPDDIPDYVSEFGPIQTEEQRAQYRESFSRDYDEYLSLHSVIEEVTARFTKLEQRITALQRDTDEYKEVKKLVIEEYEQVKQSQFHEQRARYRYLHQRLGLIKQRVSEFDEA